MPFKLLVLFFTPLISGLLIYLVPKNRDSNFKLLLAFAGSYLFAITIIHILPDLFKTNHDVEFIGLAVLAGFFLQQLLEYFTSGIEHGHMHIHRHGKHTGEGHQHGHEHVPHTSKAASALVLLFALCVHAFLEGAMLTKPTVAGSTYNVNAILLGIALHRAPAAFALMTVLAHQLGSRIRALPHLIGFSLAAPAGLLLSTYLVNHEVLSASGLLYLYAVVSGNFLHISTTIVFESSPEHRFNAKRMAVALVGSLLAVAIEFIL
ncbi:MAG TPA: ZIP family metal transporter [Chryseolinea sp.]|nr:ZIP family metal transporter [Chryseolinea sp.]